MNVIHRKLRDAKWWLFHRFHPSHRYHVIKFGKPGWYDRDHAMLLVCFQLLDEFLTKENVGTIDWTATPDHRHGMTEMRLLHFWWKHQRAADIKERDDLFRRIYDDSKRNSPTGELDWIDDPTLFERFDEHPLRADYENLNDYVETIDQKQLKRLIEIREFMWT